MRASTPGGPQSPPAQAAPPSAAQRLRVNTDTHAPSEWRVNGPLSSLPKFPKAFGCKPGDGMVRPENLRKQIW
ncbi:MAG: M13-type metalloendopeptidase [Gemmatimonadaceae bacterium]